MSSKMKFPGLELVRADAPVRMQMVGDAIRIEVPTGVEASLIDSTTGSPKLQIILEENARLTHYKQVAEPADTDHQSFAEVAIKKSAAFFSHVFLFEGRHIRNTIHVRLEEEGAQCELNGLYVASGKQIVETHTLIDHLKPHGTSREFYKGILDDEAQGLFDGLIVVQKQAQKTDSSQTNKNLLLSPRAKAQSNPELKILANDVKCKHGSTIGQINADHLFYLRSRGLSKEEARRLLIYAFASEMIERVDAQTLKETLSKRLLTKFQTV